MLKNLKICLKFPVWLIARWLCMNFHSFRIIVLNLRYTKRELFSYVGQQKLIAINLKYENQKTKLFNLLVR